MKIENELLTGFSEAELEALADTMLSPASQSRLEELLQLKRENQINDELECELDRLLSKVDQLTILKARARFTLHSQMGAASK